MLGNKMNMSNDLSSDEQGGMLWEHCSILRTTASFSDPSFPWGLELITPPLPPHPPQSPHLAEFQL